MDERTEPCIHGATARIPAREFQRRTGRDARRREREELHRRILGPDGRVADRWLAERPCPLCGGRDRAVAFEARGVDYHLCRTCGLLHVGRYVTEQGRARLRPGGAVRPGFYLSKLQRDFDVPKFRHGIDLLRRHAGGALRVLDVGTASGLFLELLDEARIPNLGLEAHPDFYGEQHRARGLSVVYRPFEEADLEPGSFGAITFWDCLEHLIDPGAALERCAALLPEDGLVLALVPNAGSLAARVMHERCAMFDGVEHVNMFTPQTLRRLFARHAFRCVHLETIIPEVNVLNNHLGYEHPYDGPSTELERVLGLEQLDRNFLLENGLGYKILALFALA